MFSEASISHIPCWLLCLSIFDCAAFDVAQHSFIDEQSECIHWTGDICDIYDFFAPYTNVLTYLLTYYSAAVCCWTRFPSEDVLCLKATSDCCMCHNCPLCPISGCSLSISSFGRRAPATVTVLVAPPASDSLATSSSSLSSSSSELA